MKVLKAIENGNDVPNAAKLTSVNALFRIIFNL